jgi:mannitol-1-phosphate/altronate dehydrogenase
VRIAYSAHGNRATDVPVSVQAADGPHTVHVNQQKTPPIDKLFVSLGVYRFEAAKPAVVIISCENTKGYVIADAVQFLPVK